MGSPSTANSEATGIFLVFLGIRCSELGKLAPLIRASLLAGTSSVIAALPLSPAAVDTSSVCEPPETARNLYLRR